MGKPYSEDLRERVIAAVDSGTRVAVVATMFRVDVSYIYKVLIRRRLTGETTARTGRAGRKPKLAPHDDALRAIRLFASKMADAVISGRDMKQSVDAESSRDTGEDADDNGRRQAARPQRRREPAPASA